MVMKGFVRALLTLALLPTGFVAPLAAQEVAFTDLHDLVPERCFSVPLSTVAADAVDIGIESGHDPSTWINKACKASTTAFHGRTATDTFTVTATAPPGTRFTRVHYEQAGTRFLERSIYWQASGTGTLIVDGNPLPFSFTSPTLVKTVDLTGEDVESITVSVMVSLTAGRSSAHPRVTAPPGSATIQVTDAVIRVEYEIPCSPRDCSDGNPCTDDACVAGTCVYSANAAVCDDGDACTTEDRCSGGVCGGGAALDCNDDNACTTDACDPAAGCIRTPVSGCICQVGACASCRDECATAATTCSDGCWGVFSSCLEGCTTTYCAPFCQADLGQCLGTCPIAAQCEAACDSANGCGSACTPLVAPGDSDGDGALDDVDNCAADPNPSQSDLDGDGAGDFCDPDDGPLTLTEAMLRPGTPGAAAGRLTVVGTLVDAVGPHLLLDPAAELRATIDSGDGTSVLAIWPAATCTARGTSRITCRVPEGRAVATFRVGSGGTWKYKVRLTGLEMPSPATPPVSLRLRYGSERIDLADGLTTCSLGATRLRCRKS